MNRLLTIVDSKYQRLEYLESTGTQYIDTGYVPTENDVIEADLRNMDTSGIEDKFFIGQQLTDNTKGGLWVEQHGIHNAWYVRFGSTRSASINPTDIEKTDKIHITLQKGSFVSSGGTTLSPVWSGTMQSTPITLCGRWNDTGTTFNAWSVRFWNFRVTNNGVTKLNLVPVLRKSDNELGMLDLVEGKFYGNAGTGKFTANLDAMYCMIQGNPTVQDGRVSGFSASNYLKINNNVTSSTFEVKFEFITGNSVENLQTIFHDKKNNDNQLEIFINSSKLASSAKVNGTFIAVTTTGSINVSPNTKYSCILKFTGTQYVFSYLDNGIETNIWSVESSTNVFSNKDFIGNNADLDRIFNGTIDLNRSYIKIDDTKYKLQAVVGYTEVGTLTENPTGVFSGFSASDYICVDKVLDTSKNFEIVVKANTGTMTSNDSKTIMRNSFGTNAENTGFAVGVGWQPGQSNNKQIRCFIIDTNGNYIINGSFGNTILQNNADYLFRFSQKLSNGVYVIKIELSSDNGNTWSNEGTWTSSYQIRNSGNGIAFGGGALNLTNQYWQGSIDLNETYIKINNKLWFNGLEA